MNQALARSRIASLRSTSCPSPRRSWAGTPAAGTNVTPSATSARSMSAINPGKTVDRACIPHRLVVAGGLEVARHRNGDVEDDGDAAPVGAKPRRTALGPQQVARGEPYDGSATRRQLADVVTRLVCHE